MMGVEPIDIDLLLTARSRHHLFSSTNPLLCDMNDRNLDPHPPETGDKSDAPTFEFIPRPSPIAIDDHRGILRRHPPAARFPPQYERRADLRASSGLGRQAALCPATERAPTGRQERVCPSAEYVAELPSQGT